MKRFLTEFTADGALYAGPMILADSVELAEAINLCLQDPHGKPLRLVGEVIDICPVEGGDARSVVRRAH